MKLQGAKPFLATMAHTGPDTAFQLLGGIRDATQSTGWVQTVLQRETGAFTVLGRGSHWDRQLLAEMILPKKQRLLLRLSAPLRIVVRWTKSLSLITAW